MDMDSCGTFTFVDDVLLARTVTRTYTNSVSVASPRLDTSFNLNVMPYILFDVNHFQAVRFVANVRLFIGPNLEGPFWMTSWNHPTQSRQHGGQFPNLCRHTNTKPSNLLLSKERSVQNYLVCGKNLCSVFWSFIFNFLNSYLSQTTWNISNWETTLSSMHRNNKVWKKS